MARQASREVPAGYIANDLWSVGEASQNRRPEIPSRDLKPAPPEINRTNKPILGDHQEWNANAKMKSIGMWLMVWYFEMVIVLSVKSGVLYQYIRKTILNH